MIERYSFVTLTKKNLDRARDFWVGALGFSVIEEQADQFFMVDAGGLRLCVDLADETHMAGSSDPIIGFHVDSVEATLAALAERGIKSGSKPVSAPKGTWAEIRDANGRTIILTEGD